MENTLVIRMTYSLGRSWKAEEFLKYPRTAELLSSPEAGVSVPTCQNQALSVLLKHSTI